MTAIAVTSRQAYDELKASGCESQQRGRVLAVVIRYPLGITRRDIARMTGLELGAVAGRVNALLKDQLLIEDGTTFDGTTHMTVKLLKPVDEPCTQLQLLPTPAVFRGAFGR